MDKTLRISLKPRKIEFFLKNGLIFGERFKVFCP